MVSKKREEQTPVDPREAEVVENMKLDVMDYLYGRGFDGVVESLSSTTDTTAAMATIAYRAVRGAAEKNKATAQVEMDMDMMLGVATEAIDMITEVAQASDQLVPGANTMRIKEDALLKMTALHGEQMTAEGKLTPEVKEQARTDMRDYMNSPGVDKAFAYVNDRASAEGVNPNDMIRAGNELVIGQRRPLQVAVKQGLMGQQMALGNMRGAERDAQAALDAQPTEVPEGANPARDAYGGIMDQGRSPPPPMGSNHAPMPERYKVGGQPRTGPLPQMPDPMPTGEALIPSGLPPAEDPNAALIPPTDGRY